MENNNNVAVLTTPLTNVDALARLDLLAYAQARAASAAALGIAVGLLDKAVADARAKVKAAEKSVKKDEDEPEISPQMQFALALKSGDLNGEKADFTARDGVIFKWIGTHWEAQNSKRLEADAIHFVFSTAPKRASDKLAQSAVATAALYLPRLPERQVSKGMAAPIIPTRSGYVEFVGDGATTLRPAQQADGITYILDCEFDPFATAPRFDSFLAEALPDEDVRSFLQEYAGYTLMGDTRHELAAWLIGGGETGKGTFGVIMQALHKKTVALSLNALEGFRLCGLADASLVYVDETPTSRINEQVLKTAISGDLMQADIKNRDPISFAPTAKWIINGNHLPPISDHTTGFWRRFVVFEFNVKPKVRQPMLAEIIVDTELPGVLNWALSGLKRLLSREHFPALPGSMEEFKESAQRNADSVASWADDCEILVDEVALRTKDEAYAYYARWCKEHGASATSSNKFWGRVAAVIPDVKSCRTRDGGRQIQRVNLNWINPPPVFDK